MIQEAAAVAQEADKYQVSRTIIVNEIKETPQSLSLDKAKWWEIATNLRMRLILNTF